jgi:DNA-binding transcriptional LysR family regulator
MELRRLKCFVAVAECMHFGRAAERMNVVQSAISQQIKLLEEEIGAELLNRSRHHIELTEVGRLFLSEAKRILRLTDEALRIARDANAGKAGRLNLAFVDNALWPTLPFILRRFRDRYPEVEMTLQQLDRISQITALEDGAIDLGIFPSPSPGGEIPTEMFLSAPILAVLPSNHRLAMQKDLSLADLAHEPFVLFPGTMRTRLVEIITSACASSGFLPKVAQEAHQLSTLLALVSAGLGVTLVPQWVASQHSYGVVYRELSTRLPPYELLMAWHEGRETNTIRNFRIIAREIIELTDLSFADKRASGILEACAAPWREAQSAAR